MFSYEFLIRAYTEASIPRRSDTPFTVADVLPNLLKMVGGDEGGNISESQAFSALAPAPGKVWANQPNFNRIDAGVGFIRLSSGGTPGVGTKGASSKPKTPGFLFLKPLERPLNCEINRNARSPLGSAAYAVYDWEVVKGQGSDWITILPDNSRQTRVAHLNQNPNQILEVRTKKTFAKNQQVRFDLQFWGDYGDAPAFARAAWAGNSWAFFWAENATPVIQRMTTAGQWKVWHALDGAPVGNDAGTWRQNWRVRILRLNGSIVIFLEGAGYAGRWDFADVTTDVAPEEARLRDVEWRTGRVNFQTFNIQASIGLGIFDYARANDKGQRKPLSQVFERDAPRPAGDARDRAGNTITILPGKAAGWIRNGTRAPVVMTVRAPQAGKGAVVQYTCTLTASPDGIDTPCVAMIHGGYEGAWTNPPPERINIRPAALRGSFSSAEPPQMAGGELRLDLSRNLLKDFYPNWENYVHSYHPIELLIRRRFDNGVAPPTFSPWVGRFKGYQLDTTRQCAQVNDWRISLVCESPAKRMQKPHAVILHEYCPLDLLYARGTGRRLLVPECVQEIVRIARGPEEAATFNGNGDPRRFLEDDHPALISTLGDGAGLFPLSQPIVENGFTFPPPFQQGPLDWVKTLTGYDRTLFFYALMPDALATSENNGEPEVAFPVPVCGRYEPWIDYRRSNGGAYEVADAVYIPGDELRALSGASARLRADSVFNHFFAISNPEGKKHPLLPGLLMAESSLDDDDPNSALHSWQRTFVTTEDWLYKAAAFGMPLDGVNAAVYLAKREHENKDWRRPSLTFRGESLMDWGDEVTPKMVHAIDPTAQGFSAAQQSDLEMGIANKPFRVTSVSDTYEFEHAGPNQYMTTAEAVPLSTDGY